MKLLEMLSTINEKRMAATGIDSYLMNPMAQELWGFVKKYGECRGYLDSQGDVYVWPANDLIHESFVSVMVQSDLMPRSEMDKTLGSMYDKTTDQNIPLKSMRMFFALEKETQSESSWGNYAFQVGPIWVSAYNDGKLDGSRKFNLQSIMGWSDRLDSLITRLNAIPVPQREVDPVSLKKSQYNPSTDDTLLRQLGVNEGLNLVNEKLVVHGRIGNRDIMMYMDPTRSQLISLWNQSNQDLRGMVVQDHVYWAASSTAIHGDIATALALDEFDVGARLYLNAYTMQGKIVGMNLSCNDEMYNRLPEIPSMAWMRKSPSVYHNRESQLIESFSNSYAMYWVNPAEGTVHTDFENHARFAIEQLGFGDRETEDRCSDWVEGNVEPEDQAAEGEWIEQWSEERKAMGYSGDPEQYPDECLIDALKQGWVRAEYEGGNKLDLEAVSVKLAQGAAKLICRPNTSEIILSGLHDVPGAESFYSTIPAHRIPVFLKHGRVLTEKFSDTRDAQLSRAQALGFDTSKVWYHGTTKGIAKFRPGNPDKGVNELGPGIYLATDAQHAGTWAGWGLTQGGQMYPCFIRKGPLWDWDAWSDMLSPEKKKAKLEPLVRGWVRFMDEKYSTTDQNGKRVPGATMKDGWERIQQIFGGRNETSNRLLSMAGFVGSVKRNSQVPTQVCVFKPEDIRSVFAKFKKPDGKLNEDKSCKHQVLKQLNFSKTRDCKGVPLDNGYCARHQPEAIQKRAMGNAEKRAATDAQKRAQWLNRFRRPKG